MGRGRVAGRVSVIKQIGADRKRRRRQLDEAGRIKAVVRRFVPFVAKIVLGQRCRLAGLKIGDAGIAPETQIGIIISNGDRAEIAADIIDLEQLSGQRVFRVSAADRGWAETRIAEGTRPLVGRIDAGAGRPGLLVGNQGPIRRAVGAVGIAPTGAPIDLVTAPEHQVDARIARGFDIRPLLTGPVFVMPGINIGLVIEQQAAIAVDVHTRQVRNIVAVLLQPVDTCIFSAEQVVLRTGIRANPATGRNRPVVTDSIGATSALPRCRTITAVEVCTTPAVIGLPGLVSGLEDDIAVAVVVAHDERDLIFAEGAVLSHELGDINA